MKVYNASGAPGRAQTLSESLRDVGYNMQSPATIESPRSGTVVQCTDGFASEGKLLVLPARAELEGGAVPVGPACRRFRRRLPRHHRHRVASRTTTTCPSRARSVRSSDDPAKAALFVDFDGSLAPIVADPAAARVLPAAGAALARLVRQLGRVGVVSGRPVSFLREQRGDRRVALRGCLRAGADRRRRDHRRPARRSPTSKRSPEAADDAEVALPGLRVERKGSVAVTVHWRDQPDRGAEATAWAAAVAPRLGLDAPSARSHGDRAASAGAGRQGYDGRRPGSGASAAPRSPATTPATSPAFDALRAERVLRRARARGDDRCHVGGEPTGGGRRRRRRRRTHGPRHVAGSRWPTRSACAPSNCCSHDSGVCTAASSPKRAPLGRSLAASGIVQRVCSAAAPCSMSYGWIGSAASCELVVRAGLGREAQHAVAAVDQRALLGDEVEPVLDRVHEQHVVAPKPATVRAKSSRVSSTIGCQSSVPQRSFTRRRPARPRARTRGTRRRLDRERFSIATNTTRSRNSGRSVEQPVVGEEAAHDVLRRLDAVGAEHELRSPTSSSSRRPRCGGLG